MYVCKIHLRLDNFEYIIIEPLPFNVMFTLVTECQQFYILLYQEALLYIPAIL